MQSHMTITFSPRTRTKIFLPFLSAKQVLDATKTLLSESAHNALNDPEVLDHSMEFATDVVGDDVVQRTAGEALRNTLTYAVKPGMTLCKSRSCCFCTEHYIISAN